MSDGEEATVNRLLEDDGTAVEPSNMDDISQERDSDSPPAESGSLLDDATVTGASSTELRAAKSQAKGDFTRLRRGFLVKLNIGELGQGEVLKHMFAEVEAAHDRLSSVILDLVSWHSQRRDTQGQAKFVSELELAESQLSEAGERLLQYLEHEGEGTEQTHDRSTRFTFDHAAHAQADCHGGQPAPSLTSGLVPTLQQSRWTDYDEYDHDDYDMYSRSQAMRTPHVSTAASASAASDGDVGDTGTAVHVQRAPGTVSAPVVQRITQTVTPSAKVAVTASISQHAGSATQSNAHQSTTSSSGGNSSATSGLHTAPPTVSVPLSTLSGIQTATATRNAPPVSHVAGSWFRQPSTRMSAAPYQATGNAMQGNPYVAPPLAEPWKQLQRVSIPTFSGDKRTYESFRAAFMACVHSAPASPEYKLLQLRQYVSGEALTAIESLGFSPAAYQAALDLLNRKYGGARRRVALQLEELDKFPAVSFRRADELERFTELLTVAVVNLKDTGRVAELEAGTFYTRLLQKCDKYSLTQFHRWRHENRKLESVEVLLEWLTLETEFSVMSAETVHGLGRAKPPEQRPQRPVHEYRPQTSGHRMTPGRYPGPRTFFASSSSGGEGTKNNCAACNGLHGVWSCAAFKFMQPNQRWTVAKKGNLCYRCLDSGHRGTDCSKTRTCGLGGCSESHHRLLHEARQQRDSKNTKSACTAQNAPQAAGRGGLGRGQNRTTASSSDDIPHDMPDESTNCSAHEPAATDVTEGEHGLAGAEQKSGPVSLRTVPVVLVAGKRRVTVNAILDDGSTRSYVNSDVAAELGVGGTSQQMTVHTLNGHKEVFCTTPVRLELESLDGRERADVELCTTRKVVGAISVLDWRTRGRKWEHLKGIQFPPVNACRSKGVDVLLGLDHADLHVSLRDIRGKPGEPVARLTPLGWTCVAPTVHANHTGVGVTLHATDQEGLTDSLLRSFWEIENISRETETVLSADEQQLLSDAKKSMVKDGQRYQVSVPWRDKAPQLANNYDMALQRLESTERRLAKQPVVAAAYAATIDKYVDKGYVRRVPSQGADGQAGWLLPHFPVVRLDKSTTKVRIVFDASARHCGTSLNDTIHQGPKLQQDLSNVLLRFRKYPVAVVCDISEMYLQIQLEKSDRPYHRFLWRKNPCTQPDIYEFSRVVFGVNCSPFLAQLVTQTHAKRLVNEHPEAADTVLESTYMDDSLDSAPTEEAAVALYEQLMALWKKAGMHARKWLSNSRNVLAKIPEEDRAANFAIGEDLPTVRTLGIQYDATCDEFSFRSEPPLDGFKFTKRSVLKKVATIFDPLGFLAPFTVRAKMLLQAMWSKGLQWDEPLDPETRVAVGQWFEELRQLSDLHIARSLHFDLQSGIQASDSTLKCHVFADASELAYGAVAYSRVESSTGEVQRRLIAAKSRVAPLAAVSIPRLELMAAVIAIRLASVVVKALGVQMSDVTFWTDSLNVLYWIRGKSRRYKAFVANRVSEIQENSQPSQWRHVPTDQNPADIVSRGATVTSLNTEFWWNGPSFLREDPNMWPIGKAAGSVHPEARREEKGESLSAKLAICLVQTATLVERLSRLHPEKFVTWQRGVRLWGRVRRFTENCRVASKDRHGGELTADELAEAETEVIKIAQREAFHSEIEAICRKQPIRSHSQLGSLNPFVDDNGLLRCGGRLEYADFLPPETVQPIILPRHHVVTKMIVQHHHEQGRHVGGVNQVYAQLCSRYWIIAGREVVREVAKNCPRCKRLKAKPAQQIMAPLPRHRITPSFRAFARSGVDFAGPFETVQGRGRTRTKRYLCLFTCLTTRAVHLELAYSLDTNSFLNAFYRFVGRRGLPQVVISDNGTNFVGGQRELSDLVAQMDKEQIERTVANQKVCWEFNPPAAPHFGGVFEVMVRAAKRAIYAILQSADITDEELTTAFVAAESLINSRPLTYISSSPSDETPLTPNHFLFGQCGGSFAPAAVDTTDFNPRKRWRRVQQLVHHFWQRWIREWLPLLSARKKWRRSHREVSVGDVMLLLSPNTPRGNWPLVRVLEVFPGKDGHVRVARVKVGDSTLVRPISKLCPIESPDAE